MRITCPSCVAEYEVPASRLPPHKMVRCVRCGGEWMPVREAIEADTETEPSPEAASEQEAQPDPGPPSPVAAATDRFVPVGSPPPSQVWLIFAWVMTFLFLGASVAATVVWRADIARSWPPSARILAPGGLMAAAPGQNPGKKAE